MENRSDGEKDDDSADDKKRVRWTAEEVCHTLRWLAPSQMNPFPRDSAVSPTIAS